MCGCVGCLSIEAAASLPMASAPRMTQVPSKPQMTMTSELGDGESEMRLATETLGAQANWWAVWSSCSFARRFG